MTRPERALQIWQVLVGAAHNRQILTYSLVAEYIGMGAGTLSGPLGVVMEYCKENHLPALTSVVVNKSKGRPGKGLTTTTPQTNDQEREKVFQHKWYQSLPPTLSEFEAVKL